MKSTGALCRRRNPHQTMGRGGPRRSAAFLAASLALAALIGFVLLPASPAAAADFTFHGRGNGHAMGMSQWGAWQGAREGSSYDQILAFYYPGTTLEQVTAGNEVLTVRISSNPYGGDLNPVYSTIDMNPTVCPATLRKYTDGTTFTTEEVAVGVLVHSAYGDDGVNVTVGGGAQQGPYTKIELVPGSAGDSEGRVNLQSYGRGEFWGTMRVRSSAPYLIVENLVHVDDYAAGVGEVISDWTQSSSWWYAPAAVEAEAVAARSYASAKDAGGTLLDNARDICYRGYTFEAQYPGLRAASDATAGKILTYGGLAIWAYSSAHSGGFTTEKAWSESGAPPYIVAQYDPWSLASPPDGTYEGGTGSGRAEDNPGWCWTRTISASSLGDKINGILKDVNGDYVDVGTPVKLTVLTRETSDPLSRPQTLQIIGSAGSATVKFYDPRTWSKSFWSVLGYSSIRWYVYRIDSPGDCETPCTVIRGVDRFDTAIKISQAMFPPETYPDGLPAGSGVVLAPGWESYQEALCAAPLAAAYGGPVLLSLTTILSTGVRDEILRLDPDCVLLVGLPESIKTAVQAAVGAGVTVTAINGSDVYEMSYLVAKALGERVDATGGDISTAIGIVTVGYNFPDAIGVSPLACHKKWPVLLTDHGSDECPMNTWAVQAMNELGITSYVKAGTYAPDPEGIAGLANFSGVDRYETNRNAAVWGKNTSGLTYSHLGIATGDKFPDALAAGPYMARDHGILLLSPLNGPLPACISYEIAGNSASIQKVTFIAMIEPVISQVQALLP